MKFNGHNIRISSLAKIGANVRIGDGTIIYDNVEIGDNSVIANDCVIGEPSQDYYSNGSYENARTKIGPSALIRSHSIIYAGVSIGSNLSTGHRITIRENSIIGNHCKIGTNSDLQGELTIGHYCQLHSNVHLCQYSSLGNYVFIYPNTVLANDKHPPSEQVKGPEIGDFTQVGIQVSIIGDVQIGQNCLIAAGAVIAKTFDDFSLILGNPARRTSDIRDLRDDKNDALYPWKDRFLRGMPWENNGENQ